MINNRQNGRRRGRGGGGNNGQRPGGGGGNRDNGNRIDNRARGNAAQLLEKYKSLARDAQMQGDRVNTEYYLQFADHYFRVLSDSRSRQDEQRRQNGSYQAGYDDMDEDFDDEGVADFSPQQQASRREPRPEQDEVRAEQPRRDMEPQRRDHEQPPRRDAEQQPPRREYRDDRPRRDARPADDRTRRDERPAQQPRGLEGEPVALNGGSHQAQPQSQPQLPIGEPAVDEAPPRRRGRPRRDAVEQPAADTSPATFDAGVLPPSIGVPATDGDDTPKPRRRRRVASDEATAAE